MAMSVFMHSARKLPVLNNTVSKLLRTQFNNSQLVFTPIIAKNFSGLNRPIIDTKKLTLQNQLAIPQSRELSHSAIWTAEKTLSAALLAVIPGCLFIASPMTDHILAVAIVLHMHWGVEAVVVDYIRPSLVGKVIPSIARAIVYMISIFTLAGLLYFNFNDVGISQAVRRLWSIKPRSSGQQ